MGLFGFVRQSTTATTSTNKSFISQAEQVAYQNGGGKPSETRSFQAYLDASSRLDTIIRTSASVASSAKFLYGKVDTKDKFKKTKFKQTDGLYMNDYMTEGDFLFELFGTLLTYDKVLLIPEESKYPYREGLIDWTIIPDNQFKIKVGNNQTIDSFIHTSSSGVETSFAYEDCIYITRNLTSNNLVYAVPRLKALMRTVENILGIHSFMKEYINSGGKASVIASTDSLLSGDQAKAIKTEIQTFLNSQAPKALIMNSEKFSLNKVSDSLSTSGVLEIMTTLSNELTKAFNMPLYLLGEYSSSTQGQTMVMANRTWFELTLRPLFNTLTNAFTRHFRDSFGIKNAMVKFDFSNIQILEDSDSEKLDIVERSIKTGLMSVNEGRVMMGWEELPQEGANRHFAPAYLLSGYPISFENFDQDVARNLEGNSNATDIPNGDGGVNNTQGLGGAE